MKPAAEMESIAAACYEELLAAFEDESSIFGETLQRSVLEAAARDRDRSLIEMSAEVIVEVERADEACTEISLGFPFPLIVRQLPSPMAPGHLVSIHLRGGRLRSLQRNLLLQQLDMPAKRLEIGEFREACASLLRGRDRVIYVDPYEYLGDSFIGLYFLEQVQAAFGIVHRSIYTRAREHMEFLGGVNSLDPEAVAQAASGDAVLLMPDLIDVHLSTTLEVLESVAANAAPILLVGRNIAVDPAGRVAYCRDGPDPELRNSNIQDYMDDCLAPYLPGQRRELVYGNPGPAPSLPGQRKVDVYADPAPTPIRPGAALINPFSSIPQRDQTCAVIRNIVAALREMRYQRVIISRGVASSSKDVDLCGRLERMLQEEGLTENVELKQFSDLSDMADFVTREAVETAFSPCTSVPHLMTHLPTTIFTTYLTTFWDPTSFQSLSSDSPLGFCRYSPKHIPVLLGPESMFGSTESWCELLRCYIDHVRGEELEDEGAAFRGKVEGLRRARPVDLSRLVEETVALYDRLIGRLDLEALEAAFNLPYYLGILQKLDSERSGRLCYSMFKISPLYKYLG